jgi:hypothetical protein
MSSANITMDVRILSAQSGISHTVLLTTFRRNGQGVSTPIGAVSANGKLYFMTPAHTWKVKRLAKNPSVTLTLCTYQGKVQSPTVEGTARRLTGAEAKQARVQLRMGARGWFWNIIFSLRYPGEKTAVYEISLTTDKSYREE